MRLTKIFSCFLALFLVVAPAAANVVTNKGDQYKHNQDGTWTLRTTNPVDGSISFHFNAAPPEIPSVVGLQGLCTTFAPYEIVVPPVSSFEAVQTFMYGGAHRMAVTTTFYFDPANDYKLFVYELQGGRWVLIYSEVYATRANRNGLAVADMNNDGIPDILVGHDSGYTQFRGTATGGYQIRAAEVGDEADIVLVYDVDGDGFLDVITIPWSKTISVYYNDRSGGVDHIEQTTDTFAGYNSAAIGDVDGDSVAELIIMSGQGLVANFSVRELTPGLPLVKAYWIDLTTHVSTQAVGVYDSSDDGFGDVMLAEDGNSPVNIYRYEQQGGTLKEPPKKTSTYDIPGTFVVGDFDCDGKPDLTTVHNGWNNVGRYTTLPGGGLSVEELCSVPYASWYNPVVGMAGNDLGLYLADYNNGIVFLPKLCCIAPPPPTLIQEIHRGIDIDYFMSPPPSEVTVCRVDDKTQIVTPFPTTNQTCSAAGAMCTSVGEVKASPAIGFYQPVSACGGGFAGRE